MKIHVIHLHSVWHGAIATCMHPKTTLSRHLRMLTGRTFVNRARVRRGSSNLEDIRDARDLVRWTVAQRDCVWLNTGTCR